MGAAFLPSQGFITHPPRSCGQNAPETKKKKKEKLKKKKEAASPERAVRSKSQEVCGPTALGGPGGDSRTGQRSPGLSPQRRGQLRSGGPDRRDAGPDKSAASSPRWGRGQWAPVGAEGRTMPPGRRAGP